MKINYRQKYLRSHLIFALIWSFYCLLEFMLKEERNWISYGWIFISIAWFCIYFYSKNYPYISIENGILQVGGPWGKKVNLNDIQNIQKFAGDYKIYTKNKLIKINTHIISAESLKELNDFFNKLEMKWI